MDCPVCETKLTALFNGIILDQYNVTYFKCNTCGLIKTEEPYWLEESYSDAIADLDVGLVSRNVSLVKRVSTIIENYFNCDGKFLDYAGGYGLFVRMMRDRGFDFYREDKYCQNIFARYFDIANCNNESKFELITAIEFLEHTVDPVNVMRGLLKRSDSVLFTTDLQPDNLSNINDWWYFSPETGQHITFFTEVTLSYLSDLLGTSYYSDGRNLHLFTKKKFHNINLASAKYPKFDIQSRIKSLLHHLLGIKIVNENRRPKSLVWPDYHTIKKFKK